MSLRRPLCTKLSHVVCDHIFHFGRYLWRISTSPSNYTCVVGILPLVKLAVSKFHVFLCLLVESFINVLSAHPSTYWLPFTHLDGKERKGSPS